MFSLTSEVLLADNAVQGKILKPRYDPGAAEEIVRMILSDNERTPVIDMSPEGPTELVFPGDSNIVKCANTSTFIKEAKEEASSLQSRGGKWFTDVVFYVNDAILTPENIGAALSRTPAVICRYEHGGKIFRRQVKFRLNEKKRHAVVFFEREEDRIFDEFMSRGLLTPRIITVKSQPAVDDTSRRAEDSGKIQVEVETQPKAKVITIRRQPNGGRETPASEDSEGVPADPSKPRIIRAHKEGERK